MTSISEYQSTTGSYMKAAKSPQSAYDRELIVLLHTLGERLASPVGLFSLIRVAIRYRNKLSRQRFSLRSSQLKNLSLARSVDYSQYAP